MKICLYIELKPQSDVIRRSCGLQSATHRVFDSHYASRHRRHHTWGRMLIQSSVSGGQIAHQSRSHPLKWRVRVNRQANAWIITAGPPRRSLWWRCVFNRWHHAAAIRAWMERATSRNKNPVPPTYMMHNTAALTAASQGSVIKAPQPSRAEEQEASFCEPIHHGLAAHLKHL